MNVKDIGYFLRGTIFDPGKAPRVMAVKPHAAPPDAPLISCVMPTRGHIFPARYGIECFRRQNYPNLELVVVCTSSDSEVEAYLRTLGDPRISFHRMASAENVGEMRNFAIAKCRGELIAVWDDDDLSHPDRLTLQFNALRGTRSKASYLARIMLWWPAMSRLAISDIRFWEGTMLVERDVLPNYDRQIRGSDSVVVDRIRASSRMVIVDHPASYCYVLHGRNLWGGRHFDIFFSRATVSFDGDAYATAVADLAPDVPIAEYAVNFFKQMRQRPIGGPDEQRALRQGQAKQGQARGGAGRQRESLDTSQFEPGSLPASEPN